jgi:predicted RNA binding protein YcfA (HicA-like mRNA interferase family)
MNTAPASVVAHLGEPTYQILTAYFANIYRGPVKVRDLVKLIENDGWLGADKRRSSSIQHPTKPGLVTIPGRLGDLAVGTLNNILKQAGLKQ